MKHIRKKSICLLAALAIAGGCVGCSGNPPATPTGQGTTATEPTVNQYKDPSATHFYEEVREGFLVDAEVIAPAGSTSCECYNAEPMLFTTDQIEAFLKANGDTLVSGSEEVSTPYSTYLVDCGSGSTLVFQTYLSGHPGSVLGYTKGEEYYYYSAYRIIPYLSISESFEGTNADRFTEEKDFSFATAEQAEQKVRQALTALGLPELTLNLALYVDHETMAKLEQELAASSDATDSYPLKGDWSSADDAYVFSFSMDIGGIPLSHRIETRRSGNYAGCEVCVCYTESGIISLYIMAPWTVKEPVGDPAPLITAGAAVEKARQKLVSVLTYQDLVIEQVRLEYQYYQEGENWLLIPVWSVRASHAMEFNDGRSCEYINIDAITGQEI